MQGVDIGGRGGFKFEYLRVRIDRLVWESEGTKDGRGRGVSIVKTVEEVYVYVFGEGWDW